MKKYYYASGQRIAMRTGSGQVQFIIGDHLGSTGVVANLDGSFYSSLRYKAWGEIRYANGVTPTRYQYTGQYSYAADFGLLFYNARWLDPQLARFAQADTIVPNPLESSAFDRFAYARNNPTRYNDPTGHCAEDDTACKNLRAKLYKEYGITIEGIWELALVQAMFSGAQKITQWLTDHGGDGLARFRAYWGGTTIKHHINIPLVYGDDNNVTLGNTIYAGNNITEGVFIHELGHVLDNVLGKMDAENTRILHNDKILDAAIFGGGPSDKFATDVGGELCFPRNHCNYKPGDSTNLQGKALEGPSEDFAEAFLNATSQPATLKAASTLRYEWMDKFAYSLSMTATEFSK